MKTTTNHQPRGQHSIFNSSLFVESKKAFGWISAYGVGQHSAADFNPSSTATDLLTANAKYQMALGQIPDLWQVCFDLYSTFNNADAPFNALQFIPVLRKLNSISEAEMELFLRNPETNHILIHNELIKVVLIHWHPGKTSGIHGHPKGGCVFKVLYGSIEEMRYTSGPSPQLLSVSKCEKGAMGYIDDQMAYHAVGNPFETSAVSLHVYTPGPK
ncbi:MAG: cysteine dioxygenase family protein [Cyclobacteriaceae bacterium]|nr:cysteine dioxygenase family protein [Cyclobacteriaceae bacterium]MDH4297304.1 cysteine dioxygenase family protein [Cyclobacteriaceae bacterium]MDH5250635.1 cysteine dioxygenase family protein [Cyclobacteriaceae bacterium]